MRQRYDANASNKAGIRGSVFPEYQQDCRRFLSLNGVRFFCLQTTILPTIFTPMFSFFRKKSELDQLTDQYRALLEESFKLSTTDRKASDLKRAEAEEVAVKMEELQKNAK